MTFRNGLMHGAPIMKEISMPPGVRRYRVGSLHVLSVPGAVLFFDSDHLGSLVRVYHLRCPTHKFKPPQRLKQRVSIITLR